MTLHLRAHRLRLRSAAFIAALLVATAAGADVAAPPAVEVLHGEIESTSGCRNDYTLYRPSRPATALAVMVVPGFMRDRDRMRGWADAIAGRGMTVVTMDFCQPTAFDGRHAENARDMIAVREALGLHAIVYVGHSAGGLASLLAAADDGAARAMVLLDPVDFADLAEAAAVRATVPALVLLARPGICNLRSNVRHALPRLVNATVVNVDAATHCDFEWPPSALCRAACDFGGPSRERRVAAEQRIRSLALDFIDSMRAVAGDEPSPPSRPAPAEAEARPADPVPAGAAASAP
jgi:pimeloyl-ACP methyl ester carboxylesterase